MRHLLLASNDFTVALHNPNRITPIQKIAYRPRFFPQLPLVWSEDPQEEIHGDVVILPD